MIIKLIMFETFNSQDLISLMPRCCMIETKKDLIACMIEVNILAYMIEL